MYLTYTSNTSSTPIPYLKTVSIIKNRFRHRCDWLVLKFVGIIVSLKDIFLKNYFAFVGKHILEQKIWPSKHILLNN